MLTVVLSQDMVYYVTSVLATRGLSVLVSWVLWCPTATIYFNNNCFASSQMIMKIRVWWVHYCTLSAIRTLAGQP